jgi:putative Holliday junction resolvase
LAERVLGLDYGTRRIGVAVSDGAGVSAHPLTVIDTATQPLASRLREIISEYGVTCIVVGLPTSLSGGEGDVAKQARAFARDVGAETGLPVTLFNEQFTTVEAERVLLEAGTRRSKRREVRDKMAAAVMLQGYLDSSR